jgi:response regulator NasT
MRAVICEDEAITMMQLRQALNINGFEVVGETMSGEEAYKAVCDLMPDVILMDINIHGMSGVEATRQIMRDCPTAVIMLTAYSDDQTVNEAMDAGACCYLVKPIVAEQLVPALKTAFARFKDMNDAIAENAELKHNLTARKLIEKAKGILMSRLSITDTQALTKMQTIAEEKGKPVEQVASDIINANSVLS